MKAQVCVTLKHGILDPQGKAIEGALHSLGVEAVKSVRQGKVFDIEVAAQSEEEANSILRDACQKLLVNQVIEDFSIGFIKVQRVDVQINHDEA